jgi:hypothetical protein
MIDGVSQCQPRASGGRRSEVKEEGRAQPGPGDMSAAGHPMALACAQELVFQAGAAGT